MTCSFHTAQCASPLDFFFELGKRIPFLSSPRKVPSAIPFPATLTPPKVGAGCEISLQILAGHEFTNGELLSTLLGLGNRNRLNLYHPKLLAELKRLAEVDTDEQLLSSQAQYRALNNLKFKVGLETYQRLIGELTQGLVSEARPKFHARNHGNPVTDRKDMQRLFGFRLLPDDDVAFSDPAYLAKALANTHVAVASQYESQGMRVKKDFSQAWDSLSPNSEVIHFTITGTEAINSLYPALKSAYIERQTKLTGTVPPVLDVEILAFNGQWGGSNGPASSLHNPKAWPGAQTKDPLLQLPVSASLSPDAAEIARISPIEEAVLLDIRRRVSKADPKRPVGGLLMEPILGAGGVYFYRPEFLRRLRTLCDELKVPIIADEILTGGGRTGKFFAFEHYSGFEPDLIAFGKGLYVAGVARVKRTSNGIFTDERGIASTVSFPYDSGIFGTTINQYNEPLLKSTQIMTRIRDDNLMDNAREVGDYFLQRLRAQKEGGSDPQLQPRGIGLLVNDPSNFANSIGLKVSENGRLLPYLTLTKSDVDAMFAEKEAVEERREIERARRTPSSTLKKP